MEISWQIDDGYAGGSRPQHTYVPDEEIQECATEEEVYDLIDAYIREDMANVGWSIDTFSTADAMNLAEVEYD